MKEGFTRIIAEIPIDLCKQAKIKAIQHDMSMTAYIESLIRADLEKHKKSECA